MFVIPTGPGLPCGPVTPIEPIAVLLNPGIVLPVIPTDPDVPVGPNVILLFIISKKFRIELLLLKKIHLC